MKREEEGWKVRRRDEKRGGGMKSRRGGGIESLTKSRLLKIGLKIWEDNNNLTGLATITWHAHIFSIFYTFSKFSSKYFI